METERERDIIIIGCKRKIQEREVKLLTNWLMTIPLKPRKVNLHVFLVSLMSVEK